MTWLKLCLLSNNIVKSTYNVRLVEFKRFSEAITNQNIDAYAANNDKLHCPAFAMHVEIFYSTH